MLAVRSAVVLREKRLDDVFVTGKEAFAVAVAFGETSAQVGPVERLGARRGFGPLLDLGAEVTPKQRRQCLSSAFFDRGNPRRNGCALRGNGHRLGHRYAF